MARRTIPMIEINEILYRWQKGQSVSLIARGLEQSRQTVRKYINLAKTHGATQSMDAPELEKVLCAIRENMTPSPNQDAHCLQILSVHKVQIQQWLQVEEMTMKQIWRLLRKRGVKMNYASVRRYIRRIAPQLPVARFGWKQHPVNKRRWIFVKHECPLIDTSNVSMLLS